MYCNILTQLCSFQNQIYGIQIFIIGWTIFYFFLEYL